MTSVEGGPKEMRWVTSDSDADDGDGRRKWLVGCRVGFDPMRPANLPPSFVPVFSIIFRRTLLPLVQLTC